ncbi:MAG: phosphoglycerate kinase [Oscillospiraceae bacterium]|nr:phosphoglycerate kinase [Oscillospiraceae bacterium]
MKYSKKTIRDIDLNGKKVLLRCDFNVPQNRKTGQITDDKRIMASLPTIKYLLEHNAAIIACSHLGKPKGSWDQDLSLGPVAIRLGQLLGRGVMFVPDIVGEEAVSKAAAIQPGQIMLLENLRFHPGEEKNDPIFAKRLADMAEIFVSDAFGASHRAHASTSGVAAYLPAVAGFLMEKELHMLGNALSKPMRPMAAVLGGAKISDKLGVINKLLDKADILVIGGGMAYTFKQAQGHTVGKSLLEPDRIEYAKEMMQKAKARGVTLLLPVDHLAASEFSADAKPVCTGEDIPDGLMGLDIGPKTVEIFSDGLKDAATIIWNGPMGAFEFPSFAGGTRSIAKVLSECEGVTIVGGGDSAAAVDQMGYAERMTYISTGGGATLEFLEGRELPGVTCLLDM